MREYVGPAGVSVHIKSGIIIECVMHLIRDYYNKPIELLKSSLEYLLSPVNTKSVRMMAL